MKWIKYNVLQNTINTGTESAPVYKDVLLEKKVGYSEENLAIAEIEAYNGEYEIIEDDEAIEFEPLAVEFGGTGGKTLEEVKEKFGIKGFLYRGTDPLTSKSEDTPAFWKELGSGIWHFTGTKGTLVGLDNGLSNYCRGTLIQGEVAYNRISQIFISYSGEIYRRAQQVTKTEWPSGGFGATYPWYKHVSTDVSCIVGTYSGNGEYGSSHPNSIKANREDAKAIIIFGKGNHPFMFTNNMYEFSYWYGCNTNSNNITCAVKPASESGVGQTVFEWSASNAEAQQNASGVEYNYVIVC